MRDEKGSSTPEKVNISYSSNIQLRKISLFAALYQVYFIAGNPTESGNWSAMIVKQSSVQSGITPNSDIRRYKLLNFHE